MKLPDPDRRYVVLLGSNIERERMLPAARAQLADEFAVERSSDVYESPAVDAPGTPPFHNQAIIVRCALGPEALRARLRDIEHALGRRRGNDLNAPRTMDIDLILALDANDRILADPPPDPQVARHHHVQRPVADLIGDAQWPGTQCPLRELELPGPPAVLRRIAQ